MPLFYSHTIQMMEILYWKCAITKYLRLSNSQRKEIYSGGRESMIKALTVKGAQSLKRLTPFFSDSILFLFLHSEFSRFFSPRYLGIRNKRPG
jgi:hypothetical protein